MKIGKQKSINWNISGEDGHQIASLHADVRAGRGATVNCDVFDAAAVAENSEEFAAVKEAFRTEVEALAITEGAVIV